MGVCVIDRSTNLLDEFASLTLIKYEKMKGKNHLSLFSLLAIKSHSLDPVGLSQDLFLTHSEHHLL